MIDMMTFIRLNFPHDSLIPCILSMESLNVFIANVFQFDLITDNIDSFDRLFALVSIEDIQMHQLF